ncbi:MAG: hypothetical protein JNK71_00825 [Methyloversatilis sp.]|nr:hypothetical protein [Methyloversatilis sp.]
MFGNKKINGDGRDYLMEGMWHGAEIRANKESAKAVASKDMAEFWEDYSEKLKKKLETVAAERDAAMEVIEEVMKEEEILKNPEKQKYFSDPKNRFSRTNLFHKIKEEKIEEYSKVNSSKIPEEVFKK